MQKITLEINNAIYDYIMFFLENIPKNLLKIKGEVQSKVDDDKQHHSSTKKKLPSGFLNPIQIDSYENIATRDEIYER
jgi:hypothetical protein